MGVLITTLLIILLASAISCLVGGVIATIFSGITTVLYYLDQSPETNDAESILIFWSATAKNFLTTMCFLVVGTLVPIKLSELGVYLNSINPWRYMPLSNVPAVPVGLFLLSFLGAVIFTGYFLKLAGKIMWAHTYNPHPRFDMRHKLKSESTYRKRVLPR